MDALEVLLTLFFVRLVLPVGLLLLIGERVRSQQRRPYYRR
jgi:hypothetical protein